MIITIIRKPFEGSLVDCSISNQCGGINIEDCRIGNEDTRSPTSLTALGQNSGWNNHRNRVVMAGSACGRFPSNVILSESCLPHLPQASQGHWANAKVTGYGDRIGSGTVEYLGVGEKDQSGGTVAKYFKVIR